MRFTAQLKTVLETVAIVSRAVAAKGIKPILANLLITANSGTVQFVGTDLEIMMISTVEANVEEDGYLTIPAKLLQEILSSIPADDNPEVVFALDNEMANEITISSGRNRFNLQAQGIEEYPPIPVFSGEDTEMEVMPLNCEGFNIALKEANVAVAVDDGNPMQKSIYFDFQEQPILASTDSKRLAVTTVSGLEIPQNFRKSYIVPSRAVNELQKLLETKENVTFGLYKEQLVFASEHFLLLARLVDGRFPDYNRVLPKESSRSLKIGRKVLSQALKSVAPIARGSSGLVHFDISANETRVWSDAKDQGNAEVFLSSQLTGEPINIAFNVRFVQDFLNAIVDEEVILEMTTPSYPGLLKPANPESDFKYVLMPMSY